VPLLQRPFEMHAGPALQQVCEIAPQTSGGGGAGAAGTHVPPRSSPAFGS
jgi:hypothetical protein